MIEYSEQSHFKKKVNFGPQFKSTVSHGREVITEGHWAVACIAATTESDQY